MQKKLMRLTGGTNSKAAKPCSPLQPGMITKEDVLVRYTNVFRRGRGKPLGSLLHIKMDPDVTPVHAPKTLSSSGQT